METQGLIVTDEYVVCRVLFITPFARYVTITMMFKLKTVSPKVVEMFKLSHPSDGNFEVYDVIVPL